MLILKRTVVPLMSAFIASTALVGFAQAEDPCGSDGSGMSQSSHARTHPPKLKSKPLSKRLTLWLATLTATSR